MSGATAGTTVGVGGDDRALAEERLVACRKSHVAMTASVPKPDVLLRPQSASGSRRIHPPALPSESE
jgi:hypothetical protein